MIFAGPSPSDRLDDYESHYTGWSSDLLPATPLVHNWRVTIDALGDGERCAYCGTPVFFHGEGMADCPGCGAEWVNGEDDPADQLDGPALDEMEFDNDPDMIEIDDFGDLDDFEEV